MNIHPLLVHFPIALLSTYGVLELVRFKKITSQPYWFYVKAVLVILGVFASYFTALAGKVAAELYTHGTYNKIVETHELFALITIITFSVIAAAYLIRWVREYGFSKFAQKPALAKVWTLLVKLSDFILFSPVIVLLAIFGLAAISTTGALGGLLVYGQNNDPFIGFVYKVLIQ
jgi:uncharacterized membrane protein